MASWLVFSSVVNWCILSCLCFGCLCTGFSLQDPFNGLTGRKNNSLFDSHSAIATGFESSFLWISSPQGDACSELDKHFLLRSLPLAFSRSDLFSYRCSFFFFRGSLTHKFVNTEILFTQLLILKFFFFVTDLFVYVCVYLFDYICTYNA